MKFSVNKVDAARGASESEGLNNIFVYTMCMEFPQLHTFPVVYMQLHVHQQLILTYFTRLLEGRKLMSMRVNQKSRIKINTLS